MLRGRVLCCLYGLRCTRLSLGDPARVGRARDAAAQRFLPGYEYSLWIGGSIRLLTPVRELIQRYLATNDLAVFGHSKRDCLYDEAEYCKAAHLDDPEVIDSQVQRYHETGYPTHNGLIEGGVLLRRHTEAVRRFDDAWWDELRRGSVRDQISANYALSTTGLVPTYLPGTIYTSPHFSFEGHAG